jgi:transcriptional regulator with XRE-family HTH domain
VAGLRREELALLAGVSASYYSRLEQGQSANASAEVLDAIAAALRLDEAERRHLHALAAGTRRRPTGAGAGDPGRAAAHRRAGGGAGAAAGHPAAPLTP